jgi:DNA polymerase-3 subunit delta'
MPFSDIIGHDTSVALLRRSLVSQKVAHAYLFSGIEGIGKRRTALAFVETIFCATGDGCGTCSSCRKIAARQHPDLHLIEPDGQFIKIDQIRELQSSLAYRPYEAPQKACIIDGAERLNLAAGNALLKTLEEPPGNALIILVTAQRSMVLPTILSRCQSLVFHSLPQQVIEKQLFHLGYPAESARIAASLADGSLKKALDTVAEDALTGRKEFLERVMALSLHNITTLFSTAEEFAREKDTVADMLGILISFLRDILLFIETGSETVHADLVPVIQLEAARLSTAKVMKLISHVSEAHRALRRNVNARLTLEVLFMRFAER